MSARPKCLQCARTLQRVHAPDVTTRETTIGDDGAPVVRDRSARGALLGHGYAATGLFCSLTCGHAWACAELRRPSCASCHYPRPRACYCARELGAAAPAPVRGAS